MFSPSFFSSVSDDEVDVSAVPYLHASVNESIRLRMRCEIQDVCLALHNSVHPFLTADNPSSRIEKILDNSIESMDLGQTDRCVIL
jgi:hypothetical protein